MRHVAEFSTERSTPTLRESWFAQLDPRIKLAATLATLANIVVAPSAVFPALIAALCLIGLRGIRARVILARLAPPLGAALVLGVVQAFVRGACPLFQFSLFGYSMVVTREGLSLALLLFVRIVGAASVLLLLAAVTPTHQLFGALRWVGVPGGWVEVATLTYRYTFVLAETASAVTDAQRLRLGRRGVCRTLASLGTLAGTVLVRSMDQAVATHQAMILRGYRGQLPKAPNPPLGRAGVFAIATAVLAPTAGSLLVEIVGAGR
jgi:cobalt/nickel transport system permease protein